MSTYSTQGIILASRDFQEADKILEVFSRNNGLISVVAKSVKKPSSSKSGKTDLLTLSDFYLAKGKSMDNLIDMKSSDVISISQFGENLNLVFYFCEVLKKSVYQDDYNFHYYELIKAIREEFLYSPFHGILKLQLTALNHMGSLPEIKICIDTNEELDEEIFFDPTKIGYTSKGGTPVEKRLLKIQMFLLSSDTIDINKLKINPEDYRLLVEIQNKWFENSIERKINSFAFI